MKNITGVETVTTKNSTGTLTLNNVANSTVGFGFEGNLKNTITANYVAGALDGKNDILNVNLNGAKDVKLTVAPGFESAKITTTGTSDVTTLTASGVSTYIVEGTGNVNFNDNLKNVNTLTATNNSGAITTTVDATTGFATNVIAAGANGASVFLGAGNDNVGFTATAGKSSAIKLGAGDDKLLLTTAASGTYVFGEAGNDTIKATNGLTATDIIDGGEGTDTLVLTNTANDMVLRGVEKLTLTNTAIGTNVIKSADSAIAVTVEAGNAAAAAKATAATITGLTSGSTVTVNDSKGQTDGVADLKVEYKTLEAAATIDVNSAITTAAAGVIINNVTAATIDYAKAATSATGGINTNETTSLNIIAAKSVNTGAIASGNKLQTLTITGQDAVTTAAVSSTALETVTVSGVKAVQTGAFAEAGKLKTVNVTSTTDNATVGAIGGSNKNNTTDALNITVSAAKAATLTKVGDSADLTVGKLGDISVTATNGLLTAGEINGTDAGTITLTSTNGGIKGATTAGAVKAVNVNDATGVTVNMTAKTFIDNNGVAAGTAIDVVNTGGNITASLAGTAAAKVNYTVSAAKGVVNLTATNTGGLASTITNAGVIADALTSTITLGNAVATTAKNDIKFVGNVATLNVTGGTGEDNIILDGAQVKSGAISLGDGTDSVNFTGILSAADATAATAATGVVINLGSTAYSVGTQSVAAGHAVEYNSGAATTKLVTNGFELTLTDVEKVTGTGFADIIIANGNGSTITGGAGADTIVLGAGKDTVVYTALTDSLVAGAGATKAGIDTVTNFAAGTDKIDVTTVPTNVKTVTQAWTTDWNTTMAAAYTAASGSAMAANEALVMTLTGTNAGTYLVINDGTLGWSAAADAVIELTGLTGTITTADFM
ncbi:hypothetical protein NG754_10570 [Aliarcobacter cryaerophilus]|uniref:beta strand repeat-containing protein n=1 Tax=Aliarcobacter cryaerophilus TaxID=28198 RepID=UPI003DA5243B